MTTTVTYELTPAWDAGARSIASFSGDGAASWKVGQAVGIVCGFNNNDQSAGYTEISHGFFIESGKYRIIESGETKTEKDSYASASVFKIERLDSVVRYYINNTLVYTSLIFSEGNVFVDCSLYAYLDTIIDLNVEDYSVAPPVEPTPEYLSVSIQGSFEPIYGILLEDNDSIIRGSFEEITGSLTVANTAYIRSSFEAITGKLLEDGASVIQGSFEPITGYLTETALVPEYNYIVGSFNPIIGKLSSYDDFIEIQGSFEPIIGKLLEANTSIISGSFEPLTGTLWSSIQNQLMLSWPAWVLSIISGENISHVTITVPAPILTAEANDKNNIRLEVIVPAPILTAYTGGAATLAVPAPVLTATGTVQTVARAEMEVPAPELTATASAGIVAAVRLEVPSPILQAATGAYASLEVLAPVLTATGKVNGIAFVSLTLPTPELTAAGSVGGVATVTLSVPAPILEAMGIAGAIARVAMVVPAPILTANGPEVINETTYAVNLTTGAVTTLLLGEVTKLVLAHGQLYGLRSGSLVRLSGDLDGAATIPAKVRFAPYTFATNQAKRISEVYFSTREEDGLTVDVIADEKVAWRYQTITDNAQAYGTHKTEVGRGIKFHTAGLVVYNRNGGRMDIGGVELLVQPLSRRPKT